MSNPRKIGPIRQFSLNSAPEAPARRKGLKKQFSEDIPDAKEKWIPELGFHVSLCTKSQKTLDRPPPAKLAWMENRSQQEPSPEPNKNEEGIIAKKCVEIKRPTTTKITRQSSLNKDSILLSHQELAERLRQAWKDREKGKQNLNIFLAHNVKEKSEEDISSELTDSEATFAVENKNSKPKIILPLNPEPLMRNEVNYKNIFQKRMRRAHSIEEPLYSPSRTAKTRTVVVVPLLENPKPKETLKVEIQPPPKTKEEEKPAHPEEDKPIDVIIRPATASSKRDGFRSRTNSAFNGTKENQRPPLIRASSVPLKPAPTKPKFTAVKRRIKSASKRKEKEKPIEVDDYLFVEEEDKEDGKSKNKKFQRCVSVSGAEIITMVSLVSPEESEAEEQPEVEKEKPKSKTSSPVKTTSAEKSEKLEHQKNFTLRKVAKSVSFQQSSIHAVRSFSASFPARRGSVAMLNSSALKTAANGQQEKRGTLENVPDDAREPKRRLLRTKSVPSECSFEEKEDGSPPLNPKPMEKPENPKQPKSERLGKPACNGSASKPDENQEPDNAPNPEENPAAELTFDTPKEKQCWDMYCKMSEKGVSISFDTILRGMLTPTEYRLRRKSVVVVEETPDNAADS